MPNPLVDTCWTAIRAAADGETAARSTFSRIYDPAIHDFLKARWRGRTSGDEVDDATQETLIECLKPGGVLTRADADRGDFRGLLFGVVGNVARRFEEHAAQRERIRLQDSSWLEHVPSDEAGQATMFDRSWARSLVLQAKQLQQARAMVEGEAGRRRLELLNRRFVDSEPIRQIAADWGVPAQQVHNAYREARTEFHRCLMEVLKAHNPALTHLDAECRRLLALLR